MKPDSTIAGTDLPRADLPAASEAIFAEIKRLARESLLLKDPGSNSTEPLVALTPETRLVDDLGLDSVQLLTLAVEIEDHFEICIDESDEGAIETLGDLAEIVTKEAKSDSAATS